ncbi:MULTISPECIES: NADPH-dependent FMN reductase [Deinococcus]|uniref:NADPH-dependent oxidoreductase n=1 Tax=Deinococcus cavernae TaxID=2320857 RepID=A0A418V6N1_9DEIO|nr:MULTISPECIES: NAD(P)H-dependent oxidoreductase [Deinococcus]RJF71739.1 NADPH-dependent oxidoreductase [Deinococcus cavernae]
MANPKIGIIISSTRPTRIADKPTQWFYDIATQRSDLDFEILDLRDFKMPFFDEVASNAWAPSQNPEVVRWQQKLAEFDGYVIITAEYNHAPTAAIKNALDNAYVEWVRKPVAYVGYGSVGAARAIEQLRLIAAELQQVSIRPSVHVQGADFFGLMQGQKTMNDMPYLNDGAHVLLDDLAWWTKALKTARES